MADPLPLASFATARAMLDAQHPLVDVLEELRLSPFAWEDAQAQWQAKIADALATGDDELLDAYDAAYREAWIAGATRPPPQPPSASPSQPWPAAPLANPEPPSDATGTMPAVRADETLPFGSHHPAVPAAIADEDPHPDVGETSFLQAIVIQEPLPFASAPTDDDADRTGFLPAITEDEPPLPFTPASQPAPPRPAAPEMAPHPQAGGTRRIEVAYAPTAALPPLGPVSPRGATPILGFTLQQVAALEVEIARGVGRIPEVLAAFGVDRATYLRVRQELERQFAADAELKRDYEAERAAYQRRSG